MGDFAIVAEGITDQIVLRNILSAWFHEREDEPMVTFEQPPNDATGGSAVPAHGGWTLLLDYFQKGKFIEALQTNTYLVAQIDTDIAGDCGVPHDEDGARMVASFIAKLRDHVPPAIWEAHGHRFLFAIGHASLECWLLPLVEEKNKPAKRKKTVNCDRAINEAQKRADEEPIGTEEHKFPERYDRLSRGYAKRADVVAASDYNAGFKRFVEQLQAVTLP